MTGTHLHTSLLHESTATAPSAGVYSTHLNTATLGLSSEVTSSKKDSLISQLEVIFSLRETNRAALHKVFCM